MSTEGPVDMTRAPGCLLRGSMVFLAASLGLQWFACLWIYGMGSGSFYPDNAVPIAVSVGLPTLAVLAVVWFFVEWAMATRVMLYGLSLHLILYGWVVIDFASISYFDKSSPSWVNHHPELLGMGLAAAGLLIGAATAALSFRAQRFP